MRRLIKCGVVGGIVVFIWGMISWKMIPWHAQSLHQFKDEQKVYEVVRANAPVSGVYVLPNMYAPKSSKNGEHSKHLSSQQQMMAKGPVMFASVLAEGATALTVIPFIISLLSQIVGAGLIAWMLFQTKFNTYGKRVLFITLAGVLVGILGIIPAWNWWGFSDSYTIICTIDLIIGWFLAGLLMAKLARKA